MTSQCIDGVEYKVESHTNVLWEWRTRTIIVYWAKEIFDSIPICYPDPLKFGYSDPKNLKASDCEKIGEEFIEKLSSGDMECIKSVSECIKSKMRHVRNTWEKKKSILSTKEIFPYMEIVNKLANLCDKEVREELFLPIYEIAEDILKIKHEDAIKESTRIQEYKNILKSL